MVEKGCTHIWSVSGVGVVDVGKGGREETKNKMLTVRRRRLTRRERAYGVLIEDMNFFPASCVFVGRNLASIT